MDQVSHKLVNYVRDFLSSSRGMKPSALNKSLGASWDLPD